MDDAREPQGSSHAGGPAGIASPLRRLSAAAADLAGSATWGLANDELVQLLREQTVALARQEAARLALLREVDDRGLGAAARPAR